MARADLHHAFAVDRELYEAAQVDPALLDPVVRVAGGIPGTARPFVVMRLYQGPQGAYLEQFVIRDRRGQLLYESRVRRIELAGEMFEDRFTTVVEGLRLPDPEPQITFFVDDDEVGTVPVFVETVEGGDPRIATEETFKKALQKGAIAWVTVPPRPNGHGPAKAHTQPVWYIFDGGKIYLLNGPTEQHVPGLGETPTVELSTRSKDLRSLVATVTCDVAVVPQDDPRWTKVGEVALTRRLNLPDGDAAMERWRRNCILIELTPRLREAEERERPAAPARAAGASAPAAAEAAAPAQQEAQAAPAEEDVHVEAEIDQEVFDKLVAEGQPERVARARAKAAYVRREKARLREERAST